MYSLVEQNLRAAMRCYALIGNGSEAREYPGVTIASSGLDVPVFNSAMLTESAQDLEGPISKAEVHFRTRRLGWSFWLCEDMLAAPLRERRVDLTFHAKGMHRIAEPPGMFTNSIAPPTKKPAPMTFARVKDDTTRCEFAHIASVVFALPFKTSKRIYGAAGLWAPPCYGWVGYFKNKPVSVVTIVIANDSAGVYSLGTLPQHQGCGFGETLLRHALGEARREFGIERSVLQATPQGMNLYTRLGYRVTTRFSIYMREGCSAF